MSIRLSLYDIKPPNVFKGMPKNVFNIYSRVNTTRDECNHVLIADAYNGMYQAEWILLVIVPMSHNFESCNLNIYGSHSRDQQMYISFCIYAHRQISFITF